MDIKTRLSKYKYHLLYVGAPCGDGEYTIEHSSNDLDRLYATRDQNEARYYGSNSRVLTTSEITSGGIQ